MCMHQVRKKGDESKDSFYEELEQVFDHFLKYHMKILGDFNEKWGGMWVYGLDWTGPGQRQVADACECGNEPSGSMKCGEFVD